MKNKIKIIDLLCLISNGEEVPKKIKYTWEYEWVYDKTREEFVYKQKDGTRFDEDWLIENILNREVEILDEEDDKDIPLIPDDELFKVFMVEDLPNLNYNFKVLKEKINQVVEEFNQYRKDNE